MASPPGSLASLLAFPPGVVDEHDNVIVPVVSQTAPTDDDQAAFLTYLRDSYVAEPAMEIAQQPIQALQNVTHSEGINASSTTPVPRRSTSPIDPSVRISSALELLAPAGPAIDVPAFHPLPDHDHPGIKYGDYMLYGEMGGKRRKQPHERAGWAELEHEPQGKRRRRGIKDTSGVDALVGSAPDGHDLTGGHERNVDPTLRNTTQDDEGKGEEEENSDAAGGSRVKASEGETKEARQEQNRRAQQAFRKRREEHMHKLEVDSAALGITTRRLEDVQQRLMDAAFDLEASQVEAAALRAALQTLHRSSGQSILTEDGTLVINESLTRRPGADGVAEVERAFADLKKQSRELAKKVRKERS